MLKQIQLKISKIKYAGDSLGDDMRIEIECLDKFAGFNKKLKCGSERKLDEIVGTFFADGASFALPINIKIIERDLIFNDVGSSKADFKVNLNNDQPQVKIYKIEVQELRNFFSKKKAVFELTMEALVSDVIGYVNLTDDGWLETKRADGKHISLPFCLKVQIHHTKSGREYFTILEGPWQGTDASVILGQEKTRFSLDNPHTEPVSITYSISKKTARFKNKVYATIDYPNSQWKKGLYDIEIPDSPHEGGEAYLDRAKLAKVWFHIGHSGALYFHPGSYSLGCMTLTQIHRWDALCKILIKARKGDSQSIGTLEVVD
ncbi:MAG: hypothetical protein V1891_04635 [bacterium]